MDYLTIKQVAELLQVKERTIRQYLYDGKLKGANIGSEGPGKRWRIPRAEVDRFITERMK